MTKARNIADLGSNDVLDTSSSGIDVTGSVTADGASLDGNVVINESGANVDFRVESDLNNYAFWIDGTYDNAVRIGTNVAKTTDNLCIGDAGGAVLALVGRGNAGSDVNTIEFRDRHNGTYTYGQVGGFIKSHRDGVGVAHYMTFGTTDADADAVERMRIDSSGNVGIGTSSPVAPLVVDSSQSNNNAQLKNSASNGYGFYSKGGGASASYYLARFDDYTGSEKVRIDGSGNVLVGVTSTTIPGIGNTTNGVSIRSGGNNSIAVSRDGDVAGYFNRNTSDGAIANFRKDGTSVGSIGVASSRLQIGTNSNSAIFFDSTNTCVAPSDLDGASDAVLDLGKSSGRWKDLYLSGGVYLGGTGSANYLDDYETGSWTPTAVQGCTGLNVVATGYTKVGRLVTVNFYLNNFTGTDANRLTLGGLPFAVKSSTYYTALVEVNDSPYAGARIGGSSTTQITFFDVSSSTRTSYPGTNVTSHLIGSITYETT